MPDILATKALAQSRIGTSAAVRGSVFVSSAGAERQAAVREAIRLADRVLTKDASALQILLLDATTFTVGQNARLTIDRFVYDPDRETGEVAASVAKGAFRFMSGRIGRRNPTAASISTPAATIGIRGTILEGVIGEDAVALAQLAGVDTGSADFEAASIVILRGPGRRRNSLDRAGVIEIRNAAGSTLIAEPNYAVFVPGPGQAPVGPFRVTPEMQDYLDFFLRSTPSGPPVSPLALDDAEREAGQAKFVEPTDMLDRAGDDIREDINDPLAPSVVAPAPPVVAPSPPPPIDPGPVDPGPIEPLPVDPSPVDPLPVDPSPVDPLPVDPLPVDPEPVDPLPVDPEPVDPEPVDPGPGEDPYVGSL